jgi:hypothetical protein
LDLGLARRIKLLLLSLVAFVTVMLFFGFSLAGVIHDQGSVASQQVESLIQGLTNTNGVCVYARKNPTTPLSGTQTGTQGGGSARAQGACKPKLHYQIRWSGIVTLDWERFATHAAAEENANT